LFLKAILVRGNGFNFLISPNPVAAPTPLLVKQLAFQHITASAPIK
jgi:hypothetical protein